MLWLWSGPPGSNCWSSFASAFQLFLISFYRVLIVAPTLYSFYFYVSEMLHWWVRNPSRGLYKCLVYTKAKLWARAVPYKIDLSPQLGFYWPFQGLLLWFNIFVSVCICMYVLVIFFSFWKAVWPIFIKKLSFWLSTCRVLIVVPMV